MALNENQRKTAAALLAGRPAVIPGTRAIADDAARRNWFEQVNCAMLGCDLADADVTEFCDLAGVPD